jgi:hypothetical protein
MEITAAMLAPLTTAITENVTTMLPVGLGIMAIFAGVSVIPKIFYKFF